LSFFSAHVFLFYIIYNFEFDPGLE